MTTANSPALDFFRRAPQKSPVMPARSRCAGPVFRAVEEAPERLPGRPLGGRGGPVEGAEVARGQAVLHREGRPVEVVREAGDEVLQALAGVPEGLPAPE